MSSTTMDYFHYNPSSSLATMALINFDFVAIYLATRIYMSKSPSYLYILPVTAFVESCGFLYRMVCASNPTISKFVLMSVFLNTPANVLTLIHYMTLGKIVKIASVQTDRFYLTAPFISWFFFFVDITLFWAQKMSDTEFFFIIINITAAFLRGILFTCFLFIALYVRQNPEYTLAVKNQSYAKEKLISIIIGSATLQFIRSIYCACLNATGFAGPVASSETAFYIFDILILALCFTLYSLFFIGDYLPKKSSGSQYIPVSRFDDLDEDNLDMLPDTNKHIAVFNNVQSVNYSIGSDM